MVILPQWLALITQMLLMNTEWGCGGKASWITDEGLQMKMVAASRDGPRKNNGWPGKSIHAKVTFFPAVGDAEGDLQERTS